MESKHAKENIVHICIYECFGTAFLLLFINLTSQMGDHALPGIVLSVMCFIQIIGPVTGGHVNPAITIG